jgi:hypothetical protein
MQTTIQFAPNLDTSNPTVGRDEAHKIKLSVDGERNYALLECTSREALFGTGEVEFYPLVSDACELVNHRLLQGS